jgi:hypothetical protein
MVIPITQAGVPFIIPFLILAHYPWLLFLNIIQMLLLLPWILHDRYTIILRSSPPHLEQYLEGDIQCGLECFASYWAEQT